jgi:hypothetical protein
MTLQGGCEIEPRLSFSAGVRIGRSWRPPRRATAILGIFAVVLQAMLFAWHHHAHPLLTRTAPVVAALAASGQEMPASARGDCQTCFALSHHGAVPVDLFKAPPPDPLPVQSVRGNAVCTPLAYYVLFRSRAPPWA